MQITFLGTGTSQGVPVVACSCAVCSSLDFRDKRLRVSVLIEHKDLNLVIDAGPDFRQQMLRAQVEKLDAILLTHEHKDHTAGLDDIRAYNFKQGRPLPIFGRPRVLAQVKQEFSYAFDDNKYPGIPQMDLQVIDNELFSIYGLDILPVEVMHHKLPVFGFRINDFAYITDANYIAEAEKNKLRELDVLVLNALQQGPHISHFTLAEAINICEELKPQRAYFTHISHKMGKHAEVSQTLPEYIKLAYDDLKIKM